MPQWPWRKPRPGVDEYGRSSIWSSAAKGDVADVKAHLAAGADPTAPDKDGYTALHVAVQNGHLGVVAVLLDGGADANAVDRHGNGPLWTAGYEAAKANAADARHSIVTLLLKAGADPDRTNRAGRTPQIWRARSAKVEAAFAAAGIQNP